MEILSVKNLKFSYPASSDLALSIDSLSFECSEFSCIFGLSGSGKSTLLNYLANNNTVGFVAQDPETQIVCDKVWHELAFGLESLGASQDEIRTAVSEVASFFGLEKYFYEDVSNLSGGTKQLLNLASVMTLKPQVLLLDEPTSQLDPIASEAFLHTLKKLNDDFGTTIIIAEHRLDELLPLCDSVVLLENGKVIDKVSPIDLPNLINAKCRSLKAALPTQIQIIGSVSDDVPLTIKQGRDVLRKKGKLFEMKGIPYVALTDDEITKTTIILNDIYIRYEKETPDVLKGLSLSVQQGEIISILGGNGSGKTTLLNVICGLIKPYRGKCDTKSKAVLLPQNPRFLFSQKSVLLDLKEATQNQSDIDNVVNLCQIQNLLNKHPFDLSGGEIQRCALAKILLCSRQNGIILSDEPTKGVDAAFKQTFKQILFALKQQGKTIIIVSHDADFCASVSDRCGLMFDGKITSIAVPRTFFKNNNFYTTSTNKLFRGFNNDIVTVEEGITELGGEIKKDETPHVIVESCDKLSTELTDVVSKRNKNSVFNKFTSVFLSIVFVLSAILSYIIKSHTTFSATVSIVAFLLLILVNTNFSSLTVYKVEKNKYSTKSKIGFMCSILLMLCTIIFGFTILADKKYYFISLLIIIESLIPFFILFEGRKPSERELVIIAVMSALAVIGRIAFYFVPSFKPQLAIVILSGVALGGEEGFLVGVLSAFVSNIFFGQGAWTPWQMFAFGINGFLGGLLFSHGIIKLNRVMLCLFGFFSALILYGGIMDTATVFMMQAEKLTLSMFILTYATGVKFNLIHAVATVLFLWLLSPIIIERLNHLKVKYYN